MYKMNDVRGGIIDQCMSMETEIKKMMDITSKIEIDTFEFKKRKQILDGLKKVRTDMGRAERSIRAAGIFFEFYE